MKRFFLIFLLFVITRTLSFAQDSIIISRVSDEILLHGNCYNDLRVLCKTIGHRLSGTPQADQAVAWGKKLLQEAGADSVWLQPVEVPVWVRGDESLQLQFPGSKDFIEIPMLSLGNSNGTDGRIITAPILLVNNVDELKALTKKQAKGKIIFFNNRFPQELVNTFEGYGRTARYRSIAPNIASSKGAVALIIRSVSTGEDDEPHTGAMRYADSVKMIPAIAIGNISSNKLEAAYFKGRVHAKLRSACKMNGTALSYNVISEIKGSEYPDEIILVCGHLDSWDVGEGAHDDGAGIVQSIEVMRTIKALNIKPKRTIRAVLFMNEENGLKGGYAYSDAAKSNNEKHILAIESDAGGFAPRGFELDMKKEERENIKRYAKLFLPYGVYDFEQEGGGADLIPLHTQGVPVMGLSPDPQRYFDLHHTRADVFEQINHRELKMGAVVLTQLVYLISEYGMSKR